MRTHHTHMYSCSLSYKCTITHTRTALFMHSLTHPFIHSLSHPFTHSLTYSLAHIISLSLTLTLSLFVISSLIQKHLHILMHILTLLHNFMYTQADSIMRSYNLILLYTHTHTRVHTRTHTHIQNVCACVSLSTRVCERTCD